MFVSMQNFHLCILGYFKVGFGITNPAKFSHVQCVYYIETHSHSKLMCVSDIEPFFTTNPTSWPISLKQSVWSLLKNYLGQIFVNLVKNERFFKTVQNFETYVGQILSFLATFSAPIVWSTSKVWQCLANRKFTIYSTPWQPSNEKCTLKFGKFFTFRKWNLYNSKF